jgi:hypothetical protein
MDRRRRMRRRTPVFLDLQVVGLSPNRRLTASVELMTKACECLKSPTLGASTVCR